MDDDIYPEPDLLQVYAKSIEEKGGSLPETVSSFTKGIVASDILTFFDLAEHRDNMPWGVTANLLIRRDAIGNHRFKSIFPKSGGGEDIDFCLEIVNSFGKNFSTEPNAVVHHPWWNNWKLELIAVSSDGPMEILTYLHSIQNIDGEIYRIPQNCSPYVC